MPVVAIAEMVYTNFNCSWIHRWHYVEKQSLDPSIQHDKDISKYLGTWRTDGRPNGRLRTTELLLLSRNIYNNLQYGAISRT